MPAGSRTTHSSLSPFRKCRWAIPRSFRPRLFPRFRFLRVDQYESDPARLGAVVDPGVVGALLNQNIAGFYMDLAVVQQHVDLSFEDDGVIDAAGTVGIR